MVNNLNKECPRSSTQYSEWGLPPYGQKFLKSAYGCHTISADFDPDGTKTHNFMTILKIVYNSVIQQS